jgi:hypothetical protein
LPPGCEHLQELPCCIIPDRGTDMWYDIVGYIPISSPFYHNL